ncbi:hypothetical protein FKW77_004813 [Venturia effusa]|uniref:Uncharacterized protein n=1 Tax=Venturia effusa TaxID=50376 RepID=A0A517KWA0_9PEZI|nr:hypothetical protein FKW77_004813 [Venturia effusa]
MAARTSSTVTFQATPSNGQATVLPHVEKPGPLIQYLETPLTNISTTPTANPTHKELDKQFGNTKFVFEVGRGRDFATSSWVGKDLLRSVWKDPSSLGNNDGASVKSAMAAHMRECEIIVRLAKEDPKQPETPAALYEIFEYFAGVVTVDEDYFASPEADQGEKMEGEKDVDRYPGVGYSLQRLTVRFLWGSGDWDTLGQVPSSCQHALEPLIGLQKALVTLELEGVDEYFAGRFARGLAEADVEKRYLEGTFVTKEYEDVVKEIIRKGEGEFNWEDGEKPMVARKLVRKTLAFDVGRGCFL